MWKGARRPAALAGLFAVAVSAGMASALAGPATPAAASGLGIENFISWSPVNSFDKTATISCPKGERVIDAGGSIEYGDGKVIMDDVFPDPGLTFVNATGLETDSYGENWGVEASVTCAPHLPGLEWMKAQTASNSNATKSLTVECSPGKTVLGNGYAITGGGGEAWVDEAVPDGGPGVPATKVSLIGVEGDPYSGNWELDGFLICADPLPGQQVLSATSTASTNDEPTSAECGPLQVITGSTAEIHDGTGTVVLVEDKVLQGEGILVNETLAFGQVNDGTAGNWRVTTYAFCADG